MDLSERIEQLREAKNIRKADMAKALEMDASYYNKFEKRGNKLTIEQLEKIAGVLGVSVIELLTGETQKMEDSQELERLRSRIDVLEQMIALYKSSQETIKNHLEIVGSMVLEEFAATLIGILQVNEKRMEELSVKFYDDVEGFILLLTETEIATAVSTKDSFILRVIAIAEYSEGVFSQDIHLHLRKVKSYLNRKNREMIWPPLPLL